MIFKHLPQNTETILIFWLRGDCNFDQSFCYYRSYIGSNQAIGRLSKDESKRQLACKSRSISLIRFHCYIGKHIFKKALSGFPLKLRNELMQALDFFCHREQAQHKYSGFCLIFVPIQFKRCVRSSCSTHLFLKMSGSKLAHFFLCSLGSFGQ